MIIRVLTPKFRFYSVAIKSSDYNNKNCLKFFEYPRSHISWNRITKHIKVRTCKMWQAIVNCALVVSRALVHDLKQIQFSSNRYFADVHIFQCLLGLACMSFHFEFVSELFYVVVYPKQFYAQKVEATAQTTRRACRVLNCKNSQDANRIAQLNCVFVWVYVIENSISKGKRLASLQTNGKPWICQCWIAGTSLETNRSGLRLRSLWRR